MINEFDVTFLKSETHFDYQSFFGACANIKIVNQFYKIFENEKIALYIKLIWCTYNDSLGYYSRIKINKL